MGVPTIGCDCRVCTSDDPHDRRLRPSVLVEYDGHTVLIDTTPDFREQAIREKIKRLDAVLYTHAHADHILGLDDIRPLSFRREGKIPLYAHASAADSLEDIFRYIFKSDYKFGGIARVEMNRFNGVVELFGASFEPVEIVHGEAVIHGFRFGSAAYLTDFSEIPAGFKRSAARAGYFISGRAASPSASDAFYCGELIEAGGRTQAAARFLYTYFPRSAAPRNEQEPAGTRAPGA